MSTLPLDRSVAVAVLRAVFMTAGSAASKVLLTGSYSSVLASGLKLLSKPPAMSTLPLGKSVAVAESRAVFMAAAVVKVLAAGSYSSVLLRTLASAAFPPAMSTLPLGSSVAVGTRRDEFIVAESGF